MARKKLTRKELVQKDEITSVLESVTTYVMEHGKPIAIGVSAAVAGIAIIVVLNVAAANREAAAQSALAEVIRVYATVTEDTSDEARFQATLAEAARVESDYPDQPATQIARYFAGLSHQGLENSDQAIAIFAGLAESGDEMISQVARVALAESYKSQGDLEHAIEVYQALADTGGYSQSAVLYELGRLHEATSMPEEALGFYQTLVGEYPDSPFREDADRALRRLTPADSSEEPS